MGAQIGPRQGPSGSSINGMKQAAQRIAAGICRDLFVGEVEGHFQELVDFDVPELDVPWPPSEAGTEAGLT